VLRRILVAAALGLSALAATGTRVALACDQYSCAPVLASATPNQLVLDGKPVRLTLQGSGLQGVTTVLITPVVAGQTFQVFNDTTILVTLPANTPAGLYSVRVMSPQGSSDPSYAPQFQVFPAPPPSEAPTPRPRATPVPAPSAAATPPMPEVGVVPAAAEATPSPAPAVLQAGGGTPRVSPASAPIDIMAGLALGAIMYLLWGAPRRITDSWRSAPMRNFVGRPAQALHAASMCLYCGRMHWIWSTRRDLWKARRYCSPKCFMSAEATAAPLVEEDEPAPVAEQKKQAWWRAAVATVEVDVDVAEEAGLVEREPGWRPRY